MRARLVAEFPGTSTSGRRVSMASKGLGVLSEADSLLVTASDRTCSSFTLLQNSATCGWFCLME